MQKKAAQKASSQQRPAFGRKESSRSQSSSSFAKPGSQTLLGRKNSLKKTATSKTQRSSKPIEGPFRDTTNSPVRPIFASDRGQILPQAEYKSASSNCLEMANDLLKAVSPKIIGGSFSLEQGVIKAELVSILSDLKDAETSTVTEHRSASLGMLKNEPILCNKSRQDKNQKSLTWERKDTKLTTATALVKSTSSMARLPKPAFSQSNSSLQNTARYATQSSKLRLDSSHRNSKSRQSRHLSLQNKNSRKVKTTTQTPKTNTFSQQDQNDFLANRLHEESLMNKVFHVLKRFISVNKAAARNRLRTVMAKKNRDSYLIKSCMKAWYCQVFGIVRIEQFTPAKWRTQSVETKRRQNNVNVKECTSTKNRDLRSIFSVKSSIKKSSSTKQISRVSRSTTKKKQTISPMMSIIKQSQNSSLRQNSNSRSGSFEHIRQPYNRQQAVSPDDLTVSAVMPRTNQGMSVMSGFLPDQTFDEVMVASGSKQLGTPDLLTLRRKSSQESFNRLSAILTDRKTVNSPTQFGSNTKYNISEFKKNAVLSATDSSNKKWLSSADRELSYAMVISDKIRRRRQCLKVFRGLRRALQRKAAREALFRHKKLTRYFNTFKQGLLKEREIKLATLSHNLQHTYQTKRKAFNTWVDLYKLLSAAKTARNNALKRKSIIALLSYAHTRTKARQITELCLNHFRLQSLMKIVEGWKRYSAREVEKKKYQLKYTCVVDAMKKRHILKKWFNRVDILRHGEEQKQKICEQENDVNRQFAYRAWKRKFQARGVFQGKLRDLKVKNFHNFMSRYFTPWFKTAQIRAQKRMIIQTKQSMRILKKSMHAFKLYTQATRIFNAKVQEVIKLRAYHLLQKAFYDGFIPFRNTQRIKNKRHQAAAILFTENYLAKGFRALQHFWLRQRIGHKIEKVKTRTAQHKFFALWVHAESRHKLMKRHILRKSVELRFQVIKAIHENAQNKIRKRALINLSLQAYGRRLKGLTFTSFRHFIGLRKARVQVYKRTFVYHLQHRMVQCLHFLKYYADMKRERREKLIFAQQELTESRLRRHFLILKENVENRRYKKWYIPLLKKVMQRKKFECFKALQMYQVKRIHYTLAVDQCDEVHKLRQKETIFEELVRNMRREQKKKADVIKSAGFLTYSLRKKALSALYMHKIRSTIDKKVTFEIQSSMRKNQFILWFNFVHNTRRLEKTADMFYKSKRFHMLHHVCQQSMLNNENKVAMRKASRQFFTEKRRLWGLRKLYEHMQTRQCQKLKDRLADKIYMSQIFQGWVKSMAQMRASNKLHRRQLSFFTRMMKHKTIKILFLNKERRIIDRETVRQFRQAKNHQTFRDCFDAIRYQNFLQKNGIAIMLNALTPRVTENLKEILEKWRVNVHEINKENIADKFYNNRAGKFVKARAFDTWIVNTSEERQIRLKRQLVERSYLRNTLTRSLFKLYKYSKMRAHFRRNMDQIKIMLRTNLMSRVFHAFHYHTTMIVQSKKIMVNVQSNYEKDVKRKVIQALQYNLYNQRVVKVVQQKRDINLVAATLRLWAQKAHQAQKISRMVEVWEEQQKLRLIRNFMPNLLTCGHISVLYGKIKQNSEHNLMRNALTAFKRMYLNKRIVLQFGIRRRLTHMFKGFHALRENLIEKVELRENVLREASFISYQDNYGLKEACFLELKEYMVQRKMKKLSRRKYGLQLLSAGLNAMRNHAKKMALERACYKHVVSLRTQKFFWHWTQCFNKNRKEQGAKNVLNFQLLHQIISEWKAIVDRRKTADEFIKQRMEIKTKEKVIEAFQRHTIISQYWTVAVDQISLTRRASLLQTAYDSFKDFLKINKIRNQLDKLYAFKKKKQIIDGWREQKNQMNHYRLHMIRQRAEIKANPGLKRPLLVLRNLCMFRAFQTFVQNIQERIKIKRDYRTSTHAIYLRLMRKSFYAMRLNAMANYQKKKSKQIKRLVLKKRWFRNLRIAALRSKAARQRISQAAVFRFLALQKKCLHAWAAISLKQKENRIKAHFALKLYFKRLLDKGFTVLKMYREKRNQLRLAHKVKKLQKLKDTGKIKKHKDSHGLMDHVPERDGAHEIVLDKRGMIKDRRTSSYHVSDGSLSAYKQGGLSGGQTNHDETYHNYPTPISSQQMENGWHRQLMTHDEEQGYPYPPMIHSGNIDHMSVVTDHGKMFEDQEYYFQQQQMLLVNSQNEFSDGDKVIEVDDEMRDWQNRMQDTQALYGMNGGGGQSIHLSRQKHEIQPGDENGGPIVTLGQNSNILQSHEQFTQESNMMSAEQVHENIANSPLSRHNDYCATSSQESVSGKKAANAPIFEQDMGGRVSHQTNNSSREEKMQHYQLAQETMLRDILPGQPRVSASATSIGINKESRVNSNFASGNISTTIQEGGAMSSSQSEHPMTMADSEPQFYNEDLSKIENSEERIPKIHHQKRNTARFTSAASTKNTQIQSKARPV